MPIAAIEALVQLLTHSPSTTVSETLQLIETHTKKLQASVPNPISLSAGTDLFQRYLIAGLQPRPGSGSAAGDFSAIRAHLLTNGRLFVRRAKEARDKIAAFGGGFVRDGSTVLTMGGSRVVGAALLKKVADSRGEEEDGVDSADGASFRVIYVVPDENFTAEGMGTVHALRARGVPVATIPQSAVAYALGMADVVIVGAEGVVENGGIVSRMGTYQVGLLAKAMGKPFYVVAESHKFVRLYPLGQFDLPVRQSVIDFRTEKEGAGDNSVSGKEDSTGGPSQAVDFTPPSLVSALITESGVLTPSAVSEELIKIWF